MEGRWCRVGSAIAVLLVVAGCSSSPPPPPTIADLIRNLGILKTQQQFSDAQVRCVAEQAESNLKGKQLRQFATDLQTLQSTGSDAGMDPTSSKTFTDAIATCAASGG